MQVATSSMQVSSRADSSSVLNVREWSSIMRFSAPFLQFRQALLSLAQGFLGAIDSGTRFHCLLHSLANCGHPLGSAGFAEKTLLQPATFVIRLCGHRGTEGIGSFERVLGSSLSGARAKHNDLGQRV